MQRFDHEKFSVYQAAISFVAWTTSILDSVSKRLAVHNQLDRASTSIALNIAEGHGKYQPTDRFRFFDIVRGSAFDCAACLDVLVARKLVGANALEPGKQLLARIVQMLVGLIRVVSAERTA